MRLVKVVWLDITEETNVPINRKGTLVECVSYGEFDEKTNDTLTIITERIGEECKKITFPTTIVLSMTELKETK